MALMTVVVDDNDMDRYMARRYLSRNDAFGEILEAETGDSFLSTICEAGRLDAVEPKPVLVLMDINMPGLDGFQTAERLQEMVASGSMTHSIVVMMFTSSENPADKARADAIPIVKGYIVKPLSDESVDSIVDIWKSSGA